MPRDGTYHLYRVFGDNFSIGYFSSYYTVKTLNLQLALQLAL